MMQSQIVIGSRYRISMSYRKATAWGPVWYRNLAFSPFRKPHRVPKNPWWSHLRILLYPWKTEVKETSVPGLMVPAIAPDAYLEFDDVVVTEV